LRVSIVIGVLCIAALFLFARLGHYSLWDDESYTALPALNLWRVGDTSLVFGKNIMAMRSGTLMTNLHERTYQPLMFCIAAPSLGLLGETAVAARLPFALCGLACVALLLHWAWRERLTSTTWLLLALALVGNVSFFLYSRQCRYYAPTILLSVAIAYSYRFYNGSRRSLVILAVLS
jgi:predicted membrane-bound mannosyltransferase